MSDISTLKSIVESAYETPIGASFQFSDTRLRDTLQEILIGLETGQLRVAERIDNQWYLHEWLKKAVLLYFRLHQSAPIAGGFSQFYDKVPLRFADPTADYFSDLQTRIVPPASVRRGSYIGPNTIIMPSFVNIGAYIGEGTLVDTWATVGSCAQIGKHVHLSGGVGIGGVLEPLQAKPTIIEDNCFIGARSEIVEGVVVEEGSVISMGVFIGQSTRIYNRATKEISYGRIPAGSVVVSGNLPSKEGDHSLYCAVIVKQVDAKTRQKTALNDLLRV
jgi:2,3,4,5-tetrahydropyridine-2-carboxylate N-succinyltransferase